MAADGLLRRRAPRRSGSSRSSHRPTRDRSPDRPRPRGLRLLFEASLCPGRLDRTVKSGFAGLLSWDSSVRPSIDLLPGPGPERCFHRSGSGSPGPGQVPPSWFRTTSTVLPSPEVAGLLHPAADPGVRRVWCAKAQSPRRVSYPSKNPLADSRTTSPWPLPLLRFTDHRSCPTARAAGSYRRPPPTDGLWPADRSTDLHTPPEVARHRFDPMPTCSRFVGQAPDPHATSVAGCRADRLSGRFRALLRRRVRAVPHRIGYRRRKARFFLGFVPLQGLPSRSAPPPGPTRAWSDRARHPGRGSPSRCFRSATAPRPSVRSRSGRACAHRPSWGF